MDLSGTSVSRGGSIATVVTRDPEDAVRRRLSIDDDANAALDAFESCQSNPENDLIQSSFHAESEASTSARCLVHGGALWISWLALGAPGRTIRSDRMPLLQP
jgi:hypothetical protein